MVASGINRAGCFKMYETSQKCTLNEMISHSRLKTQSKLIHIRRSLGNRFTFAEWCGKREEKFIRSRTSNNYWFDYQRAFNFIFLCCFRSRESCEIESLRTLFFMIDSFIAIIKAQNARNLPLAPAEFQFCNLRSDGRRKQQKELLCVVGNWYCVHHHHNSDFPS